MLRPPPETSEATVLERLSQSRSRFHQAMQKFTKGVTKKIPNHFKSSRNRTSAAQNGNVDHQGSLSNQIEDTAHLHPSTDDERPKTENFSGYVNQGTSREPTSKISNIPSSVGENLDPKLVDTELHGAHEAFGCIKTLGGPAQFATSAAKDAPAGLTAADNFQSTYLQPLKIFDTAIEKIANYELLSP
ncbi:hypothetical protein BDR04DRAFT_1123151 [Suillus decipiens]|nr:hypothetical protein BDR04DRAFT_1123151 [Suillus decipiens]